MSPFDALLGCAGDWDGQNQVQVKPADPTVESASWLTVTPMLHGTFVRLDQTWAWNGEPQVGSMLVGYTPASGVATVHWVDTWHNGTNVMPLTGRFDAAGQLVVRGTFSAGTGPDWGWRIEIGVVNFRLEITMACVDPATGKDEGGVRASFAKA